MCGRYTYKLTWEDIVALYRLTVPELRESFNVAPTQRASLVAGGHQVIVGVAGVSVMTFVFH
jgi:putative SOS response-associated peptidase YedK